VDGSSQFFPMVARFVRLIRAFLADRRAGTVALFAAGLPVLAVGVAGAIEFTEVVRTRNALQALADSTALNGARQYSVDPSAATLTRLGAWADSLLEPTRKRWSVTPTIVADKQTSTIKVAFSAQRPSMFRNMLPPGGFALDVQATAVNGATYPLCTLGLQKGGPTVGVEDKARVTAQNCLVQSNGDLAASGAASIRAGAVRAAGRASGDVSPTPVMDAPSIQDPFAAMPIHVPHHCSDIAIQLLGGTLTLKPGVHCGNLQLLGSGTIVLAPGEHYFVGASFSVIGDVTIRGTDAVIILKGQLGAQLTENVTLSIEARKSGPYAGFALITDRSFTGTLKISTRNARKILGTIYLPNAELEVSGTGNRIADQSPWTIVVAKAIRARGAPNLVINADYATGDTPVPTGVGPGAVRLRQ
jgi:hypothetical protein